MTTKEVKLRFATLTRVSTEQQEDTGESLRTQKLQLERYVSELGGVIVAEYGAKAEHATPGWEKKEVERLVADALRQPKRFDGVIVTEHDRWSRDNSSSQAGLEAFRDHSVKFFTGTTEWDLFNPSHVLFLGLNAEIGKFFAHNQAKKSLENKIARAKRGVPTSGKFPYGRTFVRSADRQTGHWEIEPAKQAIIKDTAKRYLAGESVEAIAKEYGVNWTNLWKTLTKTSGTKWTISFASKRLNISEEVTLEIPPLLDDATIAAIHARADANRTFTHGHIKHEYLFARMVSCQHCGYQMIGQTNHNGKSYYRHAHATRANPCPGPAKKAWVATKEVEPIVMRHLFETFGNPAAVKRAIEDAVPNRQEMAERAERLKRVTGELEKLEQGRQRILDLVIKGTISDASADAKLKDLKEREALLVEEKGRLADMLAHLPSRESVQAVAAKVTASFRRYTDAKATAKGRLANAVFEEMSYADKRALCQAVFGGRGLDGKRLGVQISWNSDGTSWRYHINGHLVDVEGTVTNLRTYSPSNPSYFRFKLTDASNR